MALCVECGTPTVDFYICGTGCTRAYLCPLHAPGPSASCNGCGSSLRRERHLPLSPPVEEKETGGSESKSSKRALEEDTKVKSGDERLKRALVAEEELDLGAVATCSVDTTWVANDTALNIDLGMCGETPLVLGHSFAALRARERLLRPESGVYESKGIVQGPNNALAEVRVLLTNDTCQVVQLVIRLVDSDNQHLLFRSTGGTLYINPKAEIKRLSEKKTVLTLQVSSGKDTEGLLAKEIRMIETQIEHFIEEPAEKWVRCHEITCTQPFSPSYPAGIERFMQVGSYSFYDPGRSATEKRHKSPHQYKCFHDGEYRLLMNAPSNYQQYHHSEQAVFRCLYENTDLLVAVLQDAKWYRALRKTGGPPTLRAVSVDIFTTRAACATCQKGAQSVLLAKHFFSEALDAVRKKLATTYVVATHVRTFVRIDCAYAFGGSETMGEAKAKATDRLLHVIPRSKADSLKDESSRYIFPERYIVKANRYPDELLTDGTDSREKSTLEKYKDQLIRLGNVDSPPGLMKAVALGLESYSLSNKEKIILILHLAERTSKKMSGVSQREFCRDFSEKGVEEKLHNLALHVSTAAKLILQTVHTSLSPISQVVVIARNCSVLWDCPSYSDAVFWAIIVGYAHGIGKTMSSTQAEGIKKTFLEEVWKEIKALVDDETDSATNETAALNLAAEFGLWDEYLEYRRMKG